MTRQYSEIINDDVRHLLDLIADKSTAPSNYQAAMFQLGQHLGSAADAIAAKNRNAYLVATVEDADFLSAGMLQQLESNFDTVGFACFWNERKSLFGLPSLAVAPILKQYREPMEDVDYLIVVKSIISSGCVVKTNLQNLIQTLQPKQILIAAPVIFYQAEDSLKSVFPSEISDKFRFLYFAKDNERTDAGEVLPGIGGMVYDRLGFLGQTDKNRYVPKLVTQRRQLILQQREAHA